MALTTGLFWVLGPHLWVLRVTAALSGTLTVGMVYLLGREIDDWTGIFAAALCTTSHPLLLFSRLPYVMDPVGPMLCGFYLVLRGWQSRRVWWWAASGFLTGYALWGYWGAVLWVPMYAAALAVIAILRPRGLWERRWLLCAWGAGCVITSPAVWASDTVGSDYLGRTLLALATWDIAKWRFQIQHAFGALVYYQDAGGWGSWTNHPALLWPECVFLTLALLAPPVRGRMLLLLSAVAVIVATLCGGAYCPIRRTSTTYCRRCPS